MRTAETIEAELNQLRAAKSARLLGGSATKISHAGGSVEYAGVSMSELNVGIAQLELELSRLTGSGHNLGPVRTGFGRRY